jgi:hypothetical protein
VSQLYLQYITIQKLGHSFSHGQAILLTAATMGFLRFFKAAEEKNPVQ